MQLYLQWTIFLQVPFITTTTKIPSFSGATIGIHG